MTIPRYLDQSVYPFSSVTVLGLTDVESGGVGIISSMRTLLVTTLGWTEPSANLFKTPVDGAGRFLDILVTRISATVVEWRVRDQAGVTVCTRRFNLGTGAMFIHGSTVGCYAEFVQTAQNGLENGRAFVLDVAPDGNADVSLFVVGNGFRTAAGANDGAGDVYGEYFAIDNGASATLNRTFFLSTDSGQTPAHLTSAGKFLFREEAIVINFAGTVKWAGRIPHMVLCSSLFNGGDERDIYIDTNTPGRFRATSSGSAQATMREMVRKS
jgi:hypothetical protein